MQNLKARWASGWLVSFVGSMLCLGLGVASGLSTMGGGDFWYQNLEKPPGTPPGWVFGPVWSVLYLMMGWAMGRLIQHRAWPAVGLFVVQFVLNLAWTPVFFGFHRIDAALVIIGSLWVFLLATVMAARKRDRTAAYLLVPYALWVTYAAYLNGGIFFLNE
jgi:benzodiazapine receptor